MPKTKIKEAAKADGNIISFSRYSIQSEILDKSKFWPDDGPRRKVKETYNLFNITIFFLGEREFQRTKFYGRNIKLAQVQKVRGSQWDSSSGHHESQYVMIIHPGAVEIFPSGPKGSTNRPTSLEPRC